LTDEIPSEAESLIRAAALLNAYRHGGKAESGAVLGRVLAENKNLRSLARQLAPIVERIVSEVNRLPVSEQERMFRALGPQSVKEEQEEKKGVKEEMKRLPPLPNVQRYDRVVTRFAPNPDSVLHLGSTRAIILSHDYARMYSGIFILRYEDTDPRLKRSALELYRYVLEDLEWLGCKPDQVFYQSDRLEVYYEYAKKLIELGGAYVCTCSQENFRSYIIKGEPCPDRNVPVTDTLLRWDRMLNAGYSEGEAVLRVKTDLNHPNPAVRDWPAMRIIDTTKHKHPRVGSKYRVWPLYNWSAGLDDHLMGVTHIIRGQEHATNAVRQKYFYSAFGWNYPEAIHYGRLMIEGGELSKSKIERGIREGVYDGYDDPRLATLRALRRRGIVPQAIRRLILEIGPKSSDVTVSWDNLLSYNRQIIDRTSPRRFAVFGPRELHVMGVPEDQLRVALPRHPDVPEMGAREFVIRKEKDGVYRLLVQSEDLETNRATRLIGLMNIQVESLSPDTKPALARFLGYTPEEARRIRAKAVQWLPSEGNVDIIVTMPDATKDRGIGEGGISQEEVGTVVQFERLFFARLDSKKDKEYSFIFTSK
jgi:glutamyl-tRNA synthetase